MVSQGFTVEEALSNLKEAVALYIEEMGLPEGIGTQEMLVTSFEVDQYAKTTSSIGA